MGTLGYVASEGGQFDYDEPTVERLDYSKPPPGYEPQALEGLICANEAGEPHVAAPRQFSVVPPLPTLKVGRDFNWHLKPADAIAEAWRHYKARHDPPGLQVNDWGFGQREAAQPWWRPVADIHAPAHSRAAAWAWYDRRLAVDDKLLDEDVRRVMEKVDDGCPLPGPNPWPRCLAWSDEQVAAVERWLVDSTAEMPGVLRG